jgi:O-antigen/teichoic acid export membrane protein
MGAALVLSLLDGLLSAHYYRSATLGSYQAGALFTRAGYFGPQFIGILVYPKLAVPGTRRAALRAGVAAAVGIGVLVTLLVAVAAGPIVKLAFGDHYTSGASFSLQGAAWIFTLSGAVQALVQLAQLDAVARGSAAVGRLVLGAIGVELLAIFTFAHRSPTQLITTAALVGTATAIGGLALAARAKNAPAIQVPHPDYAPAAS